MNAMQCNATNFKDELTFEMVTVSTVRAMDGCGFLINGEIDTNAVVSFRRKLCVQLAFFPPTPSQLKWPDAFYVEHCGMLHLNKAAWIHEVRLDERALRMKKKSDPT